MSKNIERVGGIDRAVEVVEFYRKYFRAYKYFDILKNAFCKEKDQSRPDDFIYMIKLTGDVNAWNKK